MEKQFSYQYAVPVVRVEDVVVIVDRDPGKCRQEFWRFRFGVGDEELAAELDEVPLGAEYCKVMIFAKVINIIILSWSADLISLSGGKIKRRLDLGA